ncbi:MAG: hypothetical protein KAT68_10935 [Bacteroidales bacterium]|nr:hypothetical protein [Bacteroidales bacterium]
MKSKVLIFLFIIHSLIFVNVFSQDDNYSSFDISFDYFTNTSTFGQFNQLVKQPSYSPGISYFSEKGFNISFISTFIENSDTSLQNMSVEYNLMIGYSYYLGKKITISPNYTRFFYSNNSNSLKSAFTDDFSLDISLNIKSFTSSVTGDYVLGNKNEFFLSLQNYYSIDIENVIIIKTILSIQPEVDINFGNQTYYNNYYWDSYNTNEEFRKYVLNQQGIKRKIYLLHKQYPNLTLDEIMHIISLSYITSEDEYNLSSIGIILPLYYMIGSFSFNVGISLFSLINKPEYIEDDYQVFFNAGISYSFFLNK